MLLMSPGITVGRERKCGPHPLRRLCSIHDMCKRMINACTCTCRGSQSSTRARPATGRQTRTCSRAGDYTGMPTRASTTLRTVSMFMFCCKCKYKNEVTTWPECDAGYKHVNKVMDMDLFVCTHGWIFSLVDVCDVRNMDMFRLDARSRRK